MTSSRRRPKTNKCSPSPLPRICRRFAPLLLLVSQINFALTLSSSTHSNNNPKRLFLFGYGSISKCLSSLPSLPFQQSYATIRHPPPSHPSSTTTFIPFSDSLQIQSHLSQSTHILITIPPSAQGCPVFQYRQHISPHTWVGYISTTAVYGNHDGAWVDEQSPIKPKSGSKASWYLDAENDWILYAEKNPFQINIFRCAGLYGNDRSALHTLYKKGMRESDTTASSTFTNRIHVRDACLAISASMLLRRYQTNVQIYNLADDEPVPRCVVMNYAKFLLEMDGFQIYLKNETFEESNSERQNRRATENKRISNGKMKRLLCDGGELLFPTYREGLRSVLECAEIFEKERRQ